MKESNCILQKNLQNAKNRAAKNVENKGFALAQFLQLEKYKTLNRRYKI
jgi:hypothetical protein